MVIKLFNGCLLQLLRDTETLEVNTKVKAEDSSRLFFMPCKRSTRAGYLYTTTPRKTPQMAKQPP